MKHYALTAVAIVLAFAVGFGLGSRQADRRVAEVIEDFMAEAPAVALLDPRAAAATVSAPDFASKIAGVWVSDADAAAEIEFGADGGYRERYGGAEVGDFSSWQVQPQKPGTILLRDGDRESLSVSLSLGGGELTLARDGESAQTYHPAER